MRTPSDRISRLIISKTTRTMTKRKKKPARNSKEYRRRRMSKHELEEEMFFEQIKSWGKMMQDMLKDKERIKANISKCINEIIECFKTYDSVMLLGGIGLRLLDNVPNMEKHFLSQISGLPLTLDENTEVVAEYAMNFGLAIPNDGREIPNEGIIDDLFSCLKNLKITFSMFEHPEKADDNEATFTWLSQMETIGVRGDGYMIHVENVYKELFCPHTSFFESHYGFSVQQLFDFCTTIENRIVSKIGSQNSIYGVYKSWERWKEWADKEYGDDSIEELKSGKKHRHFIEGFLEDNPDLAGNEDKSHCILYQPDDFENSNKIFWIVPQNDMERSILDALSQKFGDNAEFISEGDYKGNVMNNTNIFAKPIVKDDDRYLCFTPLLLYRNLFFITEHLMMADKSYYEEFFRNNTHMESRDNYIERKVKEQLKLFLPNVKFYPSCKYNHQNKNTELDILGVSDKATYVIEVKAHELQYKQKVRTGTFKSKFKDSVTVACFQCNRAKNFIETNENPLFSSEGNVVFVDKSKPIYKIAVTFQHFSSLLGDFEILKSVGLMEEEYRDTWVVSLYDLMVIADYCDDENEFVDYLNMHNEIQKKNIKWIDELELYEGYINQNLKQQVNKKNLSMIIGSTEFFDKDYAEVLPIEGFAI